MRMFRYTFYCLFYVACILAPIPSNASEKFETSKRGYFSVGIGWETLNYSEHEPDNRLDSKADVSNWIIGLDAFKEWTNIFCELKGIIPAKRIDDSVERFRIARHKETTGR